MTKISIIPVHLCGNFPLGYTPKKRLCDKIEIEGHSVLIQTLETETPDDITFIKVTGRIVLPHELYDISIPLIETFDSANFIANGVKAKIWGVNIRVDASNIFTINLDELQNCLVGGA
ncbi:hypothetical protein [Terasakiella pusilla]|uniref:hypothetical protein n=1 Tax=Terasakiella pusilla TaxID=64973 RepID=UPI000491EF24|nr:hypothetical protein [Terasakiella pusilla]